MALEEEFSHTLSSLRIIVDMNGLHEGIENVFVFAAAALQVHGLK